jgi:hypothetical protein
MVGDFGISSIWTADIWSRHFYRQIACFELDRHRKSRTASRPQDIASSSPPGFLKHRCNSGPRRVTIASQLLISGNKHFSAALARRRSFSSFLEVNDCMYLLLWSVLRILERRRWPAASSLMSGDGRYMRMSCRTAEKGRPQIRPSTLFFRPPSCGSGLACGSRAFLCRNFAGADGIRTFNSGACSAKFRTRRQP